MDLSQLVQSDLQQKNLKGIKVKFTNDVIFLAFLFGCGGTIHH